MTASVVRLTVHEDDPARWPLMVDKASPSSLSSEVLPHDLTLLQPFAIEPPESPSGTRDFGVLSTRQLAQLTAAEIVSAYLCLSDAFMTHAPILGDFRKHTSKDSIRQEKSCRDASRVFLEAIRMPLCGNAESLWICTALPCHASTHLRGRRLTWTEGTLLSSRSSKPPSASLRNPRGKSQEKGISWAKSTRRAWHRSCVLLDHCG